MTTARQEKPSVPTPDAAEVYAHHVKHEMSKATRVAVERYVAVLVERCGIAQGQLTLMRDTCGALRDDAYTWQVLAGMALTPAQLADAAPGSSSHIFEITTDPNDDPDEPTRDPLDAALDLIALGWELGAYPGAPPDVWHNDGAVVAPCGGRWDFSDGANITAGGHYKTAMEAAAACMCARHDDAARTPSPAAGAVALPDGCEWRDDGHAHIDLWLGETNLGYINKTKFSWIPRVELEGVREWGSAPTLAAAQAALLAELRKRGTLPAAAASTAPAVVRGDGATLDDSAIMEAALSVMNDGGCIADGILEGIKEYHRQRLAQLEAAAGKKAGA